MSRVFPQPDDQFGVTAFVTILLILGIFAVASLTGFVTGWSAGSDVALGKPLGAAVRDTWVARRARTLFARLSRS